MSARWVIAARALVFFSAFGFINFTPFYKQVLRHKAPWARDWVMFSGFGVAVCDVRYTRVLPGGALEPVDRYDVLGYDDPLDAPRSLRRIPNAEGAQRVARSLCRKLGRGTELRMSVRCASTRKGWRRVGNADDDACASK